jgi:hypothetical protein
VAPKYDNTMDSLPSRTRPPGWAAGVAVLSRCSSTRRRDTLIDLLGESGLSGAPALEYCARLLRWYLDGIDELPIPSKLKAFEADAVRRRARDLAMPLVLATEPWQAPLARARLGIED